MSAFSNLINIDPGCSDDGVCSIEPFPFNSAATVDMVGGTMGKVHATDSAVGPKKVVAMHDKSMLFHTI